MKVLMVPVAINCYNNTFLIKEMQFVTIVFSIVVCCA